MTLNNPYQYVMYPNPHHKKQLRNVCITKRMKKNQKRMTAPAKRSLTLHLGQALLSISVCLSVSFSVTFNFLTIYITPISHIHTLSFLLSFFHSPSLSHFPFTSTPFLSKICMHVFKAYPKTHTLNRSTSRYSIMKGHW